jgi:hypothetical protein
MNQTDAILRVTSIHFDYATWHAHLAARGAPSRLIFVPRRSPSAAQPAPAGSGRILHLDLATWRARLTGSTRAA